MSEPNILALFGGDVWTERMSARDEFAEYGFRLRAVCDQDVLVVDVWVKDHPMVKVWLDSISGIANAPIAHIAPTIFGWIWDELCFLSPPLFDANTLPPPLPVDWEDGVKQVLVAWGSADVAP